MLLQARVEKPSLVGASLSESYPFILFLYPSNSPKESKYALVS